MDKESTIKTARVLHDAQVALRSMAAERDEYKTKCAAYERRAEATKVAAAMHDKGLNTDIDLPDLVDDMEKEAAAGRLPEIARAVDMVGPNMSFGKPNHDGESVGGSDAFSSFLMGSVG